MSSTTITPSTTEATTPKASTKASKAPWLKRFHDVMDDLKTAEDAVDKASQVVGFVKVRAGYVLAEKSAAMLKSGKTSAQVQEYLLGLVTKATNRTYDWDTVQAWIQASIVEATLPEDQHGKWGSDALRTIRRIGKDDPSADKLKERIDFTTALMAAEAFSNAKVKAAYKERTGESGNGSSEKSAADQAKALEKAVDSKIVAACVRSMTKNNLSINLLRQFVLYGVALGQAGPKSDPEAVLLVINSQLKAKTS